MPLDTHAGEAPVATATNAATSVALDQIKNKSAPGTMSSLATGLGKLSTALAALINIEAKQLQKLAMNKIAITRALIDLPIVKMPDISATTKLINSIVGGVVTEDTAKTQKAIATANTTPDPAVMGTFTTGMLEHVSAQSSERIRTLSTSLADVNGMRKLAESKA